VREKWVGDGFDPILDTPRFLKVEREEWDAVAHNIG